MKRHTIIIAILLAAISVPFMSATAQEAKYKVKVVREKDGKKDVYEKTYESKEDMANDPNIEKIHIVEMDSTDGFHWRSDSSGVITVMIEKDGDDHQWTTKQNVMVFSSDQDGMYEFKEGDSTKVFIFKNGDRTMHTGEDFEFRSKDGNVIFMKGDSSEGNVFFWNEDGGDHDVRVTDDGDHRIVVRSVGGARSFGSSMQLEDPTTSEIRSANFTEDKVLSLKSVEYMLNTSSASLELKFETKASPVSIQVRDTSGTQVYEETLDPFNGSYSGNIDLSGQKPGNYILEIRQGQKALYKKLVIH